MTWEATMVKWRQQYADPKEDELIGLEAGISFVGSEDLAVQSYKTDADLNTIIRRFGVSGELPRASMQPFYGDFADAPDYQTSLNMIREAGEAFDTLPSKVRRRFANDPAELIAFLQDPANQDEAIELGLAERKAPPAEAPAKPKKAASKEPPKEPEGDGE